MFLERTGRVVRGQKLKEIANQTCTGRFGKTPRVPPHNFIMLNSNERKQNIKISEQTFKMTSPAGQIGQLTEEKPVKLLVRGQGERKSITEIGTKLPQQKLNCPILVIVY